MHGPGHLMAVETVEYLAMCKRMIRAAGRRVADSDEVELSELLTLRAELETAIETAVRGQRANYGRSWAYVARGLGVTRQAAQARYGHKLETAGKCPSCKSILWCEDGTVQPCDVCLVLA